MDKTIENIIKNAIENAVKAAKEAEDRELVKVTIEYEGDVKTVETEAVYGVALNDNGDELEAYTYLMGEASLNSLALAISCSIAELENTYAGLINLVIEKLMLKQLKQLFGEEEE